MARTEFSLDMREFRRALQQLPEVVGRGAKRGLTDVKNDWVREAVDIAPIDSANLRRQITGKAEMQSGANGFVEIEGNATQDTGGKRFNYGWWIHEKNAGGHSLKKPFAKKKFLDESAKDNEIKWMGWIQEEIDEEIRRAGW